MKTSHVKFPMYCFDFESISLDKEFKLNYIKVIKKDCSVFVQLNNVCLPNYSKE